MFASNNKHISACCLFATSFFILMLSACSTTVRLEDSATARIVRQNIVSTALKMQGKPYAYGGSGPDTFDCSGLVQYSYAQAGLSVPRTTRQQFDNMKPVYLNQLRPGDLLFYRVSNSKVSHVAIYLGKKQFVHAPSTGKTVSKNKMDNPYWQRRFVGAGTLIH